MYKRRAKTEMAEIIVCALAAICARVQWLFLLNIMTRKGTGRISKANFSLLFKLQWFEHFIQLKNLAEHCIKFNVCVYSTEYGIPVILTKIIFKLP